jgi:hypothetical protein
MGHPVRTNAEMRRAIRRKMCGEYSCFEVKRD